MTEVELTRFRIKKGKEAKAQEWMDFLNEHHADTVATMAGEKMYVESVFKEENPDGYTYFYWYSVQGKGGNAVEGSESYIDKKHPVNYVHFQFERNLFPQHLQCQST